MGNTETKVDFRKAVLDLTSQQQKLDDATFWTHFQTVSPTPKDVFNVVPQADIRALRENSPNNLSRLIFKCIECIIKARDSMCPASEHKKVVICMRLLTRVIPFMLEDPEWRGYFWTAMPSSEEKEGIDIPIAAALLSALSDLLFCPNFTIGPPSTNTESLSALDSCEHIWQAGVGFANKTPQSAIYDTNRTEILKLLLTVFSEVIYTGDENRMRWITRFSSAENRHVLPLFTSLLNTICSYDPVGYGLPYNHLLIGDSREPLVQAAIQVLIVCLDRDSAPKNEEGDQAGYTDNFFVNYLSRIHREDDFDFMLKGLTRLLNNPLQPSYLPNSSKKIAFHQELLILLWKCCEYNQKFMYYVLKTSDVLEILVPILYHLNDARNDPARVGLIHMGVFLILLLSGERNFGVRLNKPFTSRGVIDVQAFTGTHADLLIIVFHKLITTGNHRLQSLFDCLLTIIVNVSPYLKSLSMVTANKLVHLVEAFSTPWFLLSSPTNHHLVFFLMEMFNNIIQYQFDGNSNLIYTIIRKRQVFYQLSNLSTDPVSIAQSLKKNKGKNGVESTNPSAILSPQTPGVPPVSQEQAEEKKGPSLKSTLADTPDIGMMTDKGAEWSQQTQKTEGEADKEKEEEWAPTPEWVESWKKKLPLQTIMRVLQILVPQVEKICIDKGLTDESEILKFLQHGTLVGLLPVPHPILIRKYIANAATNHWFRTYMWGVIYIRNTDPPIWYDTEVNLFEIQRV
ncbi:high-temperature-induced dauer-formation protein [Ditylenchus destructor]|nr:high-temperature-induced dauer-formation protein [Ditylenchus destructor]